MWKRSFVATTVALGGTVDDALLALAPVGNTDAASGNIPSSSGRPGVPDLDAAAVELVDHLRAPQRAMRANALAKAVRDIVLAIDECTLR